MFRRLRWKITATFIGLVALSMLLLGTCLLIALQDYYYDKLEDRLEAQALLASRLAGNWQGGWEHLAGDIGSDVGARVTLIAADGTVLGDSAENAREMENHLDRPEIRAAMAGGKGTATRHSATLGTDMMYMAVRTGGDGPVEVVRLALSLAETREAFFRFWSVVPAAILLAVFCTAVASLVLGKRITGPVEKLTLLAGRISRGDYVSRVRVEGSDEIGVLAGALNQMAETIEEKMRQVSEGKSKLEAVLANMTSGVLFINHTGRVDLVNPAARRFLSLQAGTGLPHDAVIKHPELAAIINVALQNQEKVEEQVRIDSPGEIFLGVVITPLHGKGGTFLGVVAVLHDITGIRQLEKMRREFVANVSHELKTPVTTIKGFTETLLDGALEDPAARCEFVEIIDREADRLKKLIEDLLDLSRIEARQVKMNKVLSNVSVVVRTAAARLKGRAEAAGLELNLRLPREPVMAFFDPGLIEQVLVNLLDNAIKCTPAGGKVETEVTAGDEYITVKVRDTGAGIPPEHLDRVFERFYRVDKTRSRARGGTGLGLSIVKHLVDLHGGRVGVESIPGQGTEFYFTLPRK